MRVRPSLPRRRVQSACVATILTLVALSSGASAAPKAAPKRPPPPPPCDTTKPLPEQDAPVEELLRRGVCEEAEGHLVTALNLYQMGQRRSPPPAAALAKKLKAAETRVSPLVAKIRIEPGSLPAGATVLIAAKEYELGSRRTVDPGKVEIEASAPGYVSRTVTLELARGEDRLATIVLSPVPTTAPPPSASTSTAAEPAPKSPSAAAASPPARSGPWRPLGYVALGVGGASLIAGGVTGYMALGRAKELQRECPTRTTCSADGAGAARSGSTLSTVSTVTVIGGAVLAVAGVALVIWGEPKATLQPSVGLMNGLVLSGEL